MNGNDELYNIASRTKSSSCTVRPEKRKHGKSKIPIFFASGPRTGPRPRDNIVEPMISVRLSGRKGGLCVRLAEIIGE